MPRGNAKGFTLIELMIVVVIVAVLAAVAYPSYTKYVYRARRSDAQKFLMTIAAAEERYYTNFNKYTTGVTVASPNGLGLGSATSDSGYYTVAVAACAGGAIATCFLATATPVGPQVGDSSCPTLTIDNTLNKLPAGMQANGSCW